MVKKPIYHLDECESCAHRHVCKYVAKIDNMLKRGDLPLDLHGASCNEYLPEDVVDDSWKEYQEDYIEDSGADIPFTGLSAVLDDLAGLSIDETPITADEIDPQEFVEEMNDAIYEIMEKGIDIQSISMNRVTMDKLKPAFNTEDDLTAVILVSGAKIPLRIDNGIQTGYFTLDL